MDNLTITEKLYSYEYGFVVYSSKAEVCQWFCDYSSASEKRTSLEIAGFYDVIISPLETAPKTWQLERLGFTFLKSAFYLPLTPFSESVMLLEYHGIDENWKSKGLQFGKFSLYCHENSKFTLIKSDIFHELHKSSLGFYFIHDGVKIWFKLLKPKWIKITK